MDILNEWISNAITIIYRKKYLTKGGKCWNIWLFYFGIGGLQFYLSLTRIAPVVCLSFCVSVVLVVRRLPFYLFFGLPVGLLSFFWQDDLQIQENSDIQKLRKKTNKKRQKWKFWIRPTLRLRNIYMNSFLTLFCSRQDRPNPKSSFL